MEIIKYIKQFRRNKIIVSLDNGILATVSHPSTIRPNMIELWKENEYGYYCIQT